MKQKIYYRIVKKHIISSLNYNYKNKFFFIHIPKNAGTAISLSEKLIDYFVFPTFFSYPKSYLWKLNKEFGLREGNYAHGRYRDFKDFIKNNYKFVAIIRNPWSRCVSKYLFGLKVLKQKKLEIPNNLKSFENYIDSSKYYKEKNLYWHKVVDGWYSQKSYIDGIEKNRLKIIKFEYLEEDLNNFFFKYYKKPFYLNNFKRVNKTSINLEEYKSFYNKSLIEKVYELYKEDIDYFQFDFDSALKRY